MITPGRFLPFAALSLGVPVMACGGTSVDAGTAVVVVDSSGVALVHHPRTVLEATPVLRMEEVLGIGTLDGPLETQFFSILGAVELGGEIFVLDRGHHEVRVFAADGTFLRAFGREGDGPGEFRRLRSIELLGDTLVVRGNRVNLLTLAGEELGTAPAQVVEDGRVLMRVLPTRVGWLGEWMVTPTDRVAPGSAILESTSLHPIELGSSRPGPVLLAYDRPEQWVSRGDFPFNVMPYFQAYPFHQVGADGTIYHTRGTDYRIDARSGTDGTLLRRITADPRPVPITPALVNRAADGERRRVADAPAGSESALYLPVIEERLALEVADNLPVLGRMHASGGGWLLVERLDLDPDPVAPGDPVTHDLFDPQGVLRGRLVLGPETRVVRLQDQGLLAVVRDDLDVQRLVKYRFVEPVEG